MLAPAAAFARAGKPIGDVTGFWERAGVSSTRLAMAVDVWLTAPGAAQLGFNSKSKRSLDARD
jgi:hypothetical protein